MTSPSPRAVARRSTARKPLSSRRHSRLGTAISNGLGAWLEHIGEDIIPRIPGPLLVAWFFAGGLLGKYTALRFLIWLAVLLIATAVAVQWAPAWRGWSLQSTWATRAVPRPPRSLWWYTTSAALLMIYPLWLATAPDPWLSGNLIGIYFITAVCGWFAWNSSGPGSWAKTETVDENTWQSTAAAVGLGEDSRLIDATDVGIGDAYEVKIGTVHGKTVGWYLTTGRIAERWANLWGCSIAQVDVRPHPREPESKLVVTKLRGQPWQRDWRHPLLDDPTRMLATRSIYDPIFFMVDPLTGYNIDLTLVDADGGRPILVIGKMGSGKSTALNILLEALTACTDAEIDFIDTAKGGAARIWAPLARRIAVRTEASDGESEALTILREAEELIKDRAMRSTTAVHRATPKNPARIIFWDEMSSLLTSDRTDPAAKEARRLASFVGTKGRAALVFLVGAAQRGVETHLGGQDLKVNASIIIVMHVAKLIEQKYLLGDSAGAIDMSKSGRLAKGVALVAADGEPLAMGRVVNLSDWDLVQSVVKARLRFRSEHGHAGTSADDWTVRVETVDGKTYHPPRPAPLRAIEAGTDWLRSRTGFVPDEPDPRDGDDVPWLALGSTMEGHLWAAHRRLRLPELRGLGMQHPIDVDGSDVVVDFWLPSAQLAIEVDGAGFHDSAQDTSRDQILVTRGIAVVRFTGREVMIDAEGCVRQVAEVARTRLAEPVAGLPPAPPLTDSTATLAARLRQRAGQMPSGSLREQFSPRDLRTLAGVKSNRTGATMVKDLLRAGLLVHVVGTNPNSPAARYETPNYHE